MERTGLFQIVLPPLLWRELPVFESFAGFFDELVEGGEVPNADGVVFRCRDDVLSVRTEGDGSDPFCMSFQWFSHLLSSFSIPYSDGIVL